MALNVKPLMRLDALKGVDRILSDYGQDSEQVFRNFGLSPRLLSNPDSYLTLDELADFSVYLEQQFGIHDLGLLLAEQQSLDVLGPISLLVHHQKTLGDALEMMRRYLPYHTSGAELIVEPGPEPETTIISYDLQLSDQSKARHGMEQSFLNMVKILRLLSSETVNAIAVEFSHKAAFPLKKYIEYFGCDVSFEHPATRLVLASKIMSLPLQSSNSQLSKLAENHVAQLIESNPLDTAWQVKALVSQQVSSGVCGIKSVANQLGVTVRTLQRRLLKQGVYFENIVDEVRKEKLAEYAKVESLSLSQIAGLLGYGDQSAFARACKRWTGLTPQVYRKSVRV